MLEKLIKTSYFMMTLSMVVIGDSLSEVIINLAALAICGFLSWSIWQLIFKINAVYEYQITHKETHSSMDKDIIRIENESKDQYEDLKEQISDMRGTFETKLDNLAKGFRKSNQ